MNDQRDKSAWVRSELTRRLRECRREPATEFDVWEPDLEADVGQLLRDGELQLLLLADDGNQLVGVLWLDGSDKQSIYSNGYKNALRRIGNRLAQAALDAGIHRGIVIVFVVDEPANRDAERLLADEEISEGEFRSILIRYSELSTGSEIDAPSVTDALSVLSPLPNTPFLDPKPEAALAKYVPEIVRSKLKWDKAPAQEGEQLLSALRHDFSAYLTQGEWPDNRWQETRQWIDDTVVKANNSDGLTAR